MTVTGTSHFVSMKAAISYYRDYGFNAADVRSKIADGEIFIGPPELKTGEILLTETMGLRYFIMDAA